MQSTALVHEMCNTMRNTVQASVTRQQSTTCTVLAKLEEQNQAIQKMQETQQAMLLLMQQPNHQQQHQNRLQATEPIQQSIVDEGVGAGDGAGNVARRYQEEVKTEEEDDKKQPPSDATAHARHAQDLGLNQVTMLRHTPRSPVMSEKLPLNWVALESEWRINKLDSFVNMESKLWDDNKLTQRFYKRHRGIKMIRKFKKEHHYIDDAEAAGKLELVRDVVKRSLSSHMAELFKYDNDIKRRVRTRKSRPDNK